MGILQRSGAGSLDDRATDRAEDLAEKLTGRDFYDLPPSMQMSIWNQAEAEVRQEMIKEQQEAIPA